MPSRFCPPEAIASLLAVCLSLTQAAQGLAETPANDTFELEQQLPRILDEAGVPGLGLAVIDGGEIVVEEGFGHHRAPDSVAVTPQAIFEAASLTKPVFAYGVLQLVEEGGLDLDRPLTDYVAFPDIEDDDRVDLITARMVLSHTTGLPNWRRDRPLTIDADPGQQYGYSGEGFVFLQKAVAAITGQPTEVFVQERVLSPLGMTSSYLTWHDDQTSRTAIGHDQLGQPMPKWKPTDPNVASSLHTTAGDYARFVLEIMNPTLVSPGTLEMMLTSQSEVADGVTWGLGWGIEEMTLPDGSRDRVFWHWGDNGYFKGFIAASPSRRQGLVMFTNSENGDTITEAILVGVLPGEHPMLAWRDLTPYDSPAFRIRLALLRAGASGGVDALTARYDELRGTYPVEAFQENMMNGIGYELLYRRDAVEAAVVVFRLNAVNYPDSWNVHDSLGEGLRAQGDIEGAIRAYEKSLELNPENTNGEAMLVELRAEEAAAR